MILSHLYGTQQKRGKGSIIDGKGVGTDNITWNVTLPNGNNLFDDRYRILLDNIKKRHFFYVMVR